MSFKIFALSLAGSALILAPAVANAGEQHQVSLHNDVGHAITCGVRREGSSAVDSFTLRAGESWSKSYSGSKPRLVLCEDAMSSWQPLALDRPYRLVKTDAERIVAESMSGR